MVLTCCAVNCKEVFKKGGPVTFHHFPKDPARRRLWELKTRRADFKVTNHTKICSKHFTPDSFDLTKFGGTWLKPNAVPSIFDFETSKTKIPKPWDRKIAADESLYEDTSTKDKNEKSYFGNFDQTDVNSSTNRQKLLQTTNIPKTTKTTEHPMIFKLRLVKPNIAQQVVPISVSMAFGDGVPQTKSPMKRRISDDESLHEDSSTIAESEKSYCGDFDRSYFNSPTADESLHEDSSSMANREKKRLHYFGDFDLTDVTTSPTNARKFFEISQAKVLSCKQTIRMLRLENMLLKRRVASLNRMLNKMKQKKKTSQYDSPSHFISIESLFRDAA